MVSDLHPVGELLDQLVAVGVVEGAAACVAGQVSLVDQAAQRVGDLGGPVRLGIGLGSGFELTKQVGTAQLMGQLTDLG